MSPKNPQLFFDVLREDVQTAASKVGGYRKLHQLCALLKYPLRTGADNLERFADARNERINMADAENLACVLYDSDLADGLCGRQSAAVRRRADLMHTLRTGGSGAHWLEGSYFAYQGSFMRECHFVKLALFFTRSPYGHVDGDVAFEDNHAAVPVTRAAIAFPVFRNGRLQLLSLNNDYADGFQLLLASRLYPESGLIQHIVGTVHGSNIDGHSYDRSVLVIKTHQPLTLKQMAPLTGIKPFDAWPKEDQNAFRALARCHPPRTFEDPSLAL